MGRGTQGRLPWFQRRARAAPLAPEASSAPWSCARTADSARQVGGWGAWGLGVPFAEDAHLEGKLPLFSWGSVAPLPGPPIIFTLIALLMMNLQLSFLPPA